MAERPWITPAEVIAYTDFKQVRDRDESKLRMDISRAEQYVISYTGNDFADADVIPDPVRTALILLTEMYAYNACADAKSGGRRMKSEAFDDYSYTAEEVYFSAESLDLAGVIVSDVAHAQDQDAGSFHTCDRTLHLPLVAELILMVAVEVADQVEGLGQHMLRYSEPVSAYRAGQNDVVGNDAGRRHVLGARPGALIP